MSRVFRSVGRVFGGGKGDGGAAAAAAAEQQRIAAQQAAATQKRETQIADRKQQGALASESARAAGAAYTASDIDETQTRLGSAPKRKGMASKQLFGD